MASSPSTTVSLRPAAVLAVATGLILAAGCGRPGQDAPREGPTPAVQVPRRDTLPPAGYDPGADPADQLRRAVTEAKASGRRILLEVGGDWCVWCRILEKYLHRDAPDVGAAFERAFVVVKVNFSEDNKNEAFLAGYPEIPGYPHFFVLEPDGRFLHSQPTGDLERGPSYDHEKMLAFVRRWRTNAISSSRPTT